MSPLEGVDEEGETDCVRRRGGVVLSDDDSMQVIDSPTSRLGVLVS